MKLDFALATTVEYGYFLIPEPASELTDFSDVYDRVCSVICHCVRVLDEPTRMCISPSAKSATHIRAALCEFVGIEDLIKQLYPIVDKHEYAIYKSQNPTLHMLKLLRNYNIHISNSHLSQKTMKVRTLIENHEEFDVNVKYISNLTLANLKLMRSSKEYNDMQLQNMINNFELQQHEFGVTTLIIKAVIDYSEQLARVLCSKSLK